MNYWLVKSEPDVYSWDTFVNDKKTFWDGVRNYAARNHMQAMAKGDRVLYYHSGDQRSVMGIAEVAKEHYPDPTTDEPAWVVVDLKAVKPFPQPVSLAEIKKTKELQNMILVKIGRLSVSPVTEHEYNTILEMGGL